MANELRLHAVRSCKVKHSNLLDLIYGYRNVREVFTEDEVLILLPLASTNCYILLCSSGFARSERLLVLMEITRNLK